MVDSVKIRIGRYFIFLNEQGQWKPSDDLVSIYAEVANLLSAPPFYSYSPAHGTYGFLLGSKLAEKLGGQVELPKTSQHKPIPGVVF